MRKPVASVWLLHVGNARSGRWSSGDRKHALVVAHDHLTSVSRAHSHLVNHVMNNVVVFTCRVRRGSLFHLRDILYALHCMACQNG